MAASHRFRSRVPLGCVAGFALASVLGIAVTVPAAEPASPTSIGVSTDLLPPVMSALAGDPGGTLAVGISAGRWQVRGLGFATSVPDPLIGNDAFDRLTAAGGAIIVDRFFAPSRRGWWIGAGLELWSSSVRHAASQRSRAAL